MLYAYPPNFNFVPQVEAQRFAFYTILIKIPESYFVDTENLILTITWKRRPRYTVFFPPCAPYV